MAGTLSRHKQIKFLGTTEDGIREYECPYCHTKGTWSELVHEKWRCEHEYTEEDLTIK
jgi:hypothetical protein